jgi:hypothetical protein
MDGLNSGMMSLKIPEQFTDLVFSNKKVKGGQHDWDMQRGHYLYTFRLKYVSKYF